MEAKRWKPKGSSPKRACNLRNIDRLEKLRVVCCDTPNNSSTGGWLADGSVTCIQINIQGVSSNYTDLNLNYSNTYVPNYNKRPKRFEQI
jgi:hypothetical protein